MAQEAFMMWNGIVASWKQLKDKFALRSFRFFGSDREHFDVTGTEIWRIGQRDDLRPSAFHPDERARRSEFSLHIGC
jgi:hypothetical protein